MSWSASGQGAAWTAINLTVSSLWRVALAAGNTGPGRANFNLLITAGAEAAQSFDTGSLSALSIKTLRRRDMPNAGKSAGRAGKPSCISPVRVSLDTSAPGDESTIKSFT